MLLSGVALVTTRAPNLIIQQRPLRVWQRGFRAAGGDEEARTLDPLRARQVLSQLSYTPIMEGRCQRAFPLFLSLEVPLGPSKLNNAFYLNTPLNG